jgi:hypothetical protein
MTIRKLCCRDEGPTTMQDKQAELFQALARCAESVARTAEFSADVHDNVTHALPDAHKHAARDRRLAQAERAAAAAYRNEEVPSHDVREVIRQVGQDDAR